MSLISNINYRNIFVLSILLWLSQQFYAITIPLIVYEQTQSPLNMSIARAMEFLPNILFAPIAGYLIDMFRVKKMVLVSLWGQLICLVGIYILFLHYSSDSAGIQQCSIYLAIFAFMSFGLIFNNIRNVLIKSSIPTALLTSANSYLQAAAQTIQVCGPILSGFVLFFSDLSNGILACIICLVTSIVLFARIDFLNVATQGIWEKFNLKNIVLDPLKIVIRDQTLRHFTILAMITNIAEGISGVMYIYFLRPCFY